MAVVPCGMRTLARSLAWPWRQSRAPGRGCGAEGAARSCCWRRWHRTSDIHLENVLKLSRMGTIICPPMPGFYQRPETVDDIVNQSVVRMLDQFGVHLDSPGRWGEAYELGLAGKLPAEDSDEY
jgi:hypothetical protein